MEYIPELNNKEIREVYKHYKERLDHYKKRGIDFEKYREFILDKLYPLEGSILELGTGTGYTTLILAKAGYKFTSIDTDKDALKTTASRIAHESLLSSVKFQIMDATSLDFEDGSFNNVIAVNLLHHISKVDGILSEADRVLHKGGKLVISDFNEKGREIIDSSHKKEGRTHDYPIVDQKRIYSYFDKRGYKVKRFENECHWILIGKKP